jgi:small multidrug resistance family-3 protein
MSNAVVIVLLLFSATLEAVGDAMVRSGLNAASLGARVAWMAAGAGVLFAYGVTVNLPSWDFGRLLGVYVSLFFVVAQVISTFVFGKPPTLPVLVGGAMIVAGGVTMTFWADT